jgi:hypothetical protein
MAPMNNRLLRPLSSGAFTPRSLSGLEGWWSASESPLFQNSDGTTAVAANDDLVGYWGDLSGNGRHLLPLAGASTTTVTNGVRPKYKTGTINGRPTIAFDAASANTLGRAFTLAQPCHYFYVGKYDDAYVSGNPRLFDGFNANSSLLRTSSTALVINAGGSNRNYNAASNTVLESFGVWDLNWDGTNTRLRLAGVESDGGAGTGTTSPSGLRLAVFNNGFSAPGNVSFAEFIIYSRILSATEATAVRKYLGTKYSLAFA